MLCFCPVTRPGYGKFPDMAARPVSWAEEHALCRYDAAYLIFIAEAAFTLFDR